MSVQSKFGYDIQKSAKQKLVLWQTIIYLLLMFTDAGLISLWRDCDFKYRASLAGTFVEFFVRLSIVIGLSQNPEKQVILQCESEKYRNDGTVVIRNDKKMVHVSLSLNFLPTLILWYKMSLWHASILNHDGGYYLIFTSNYYIRQRSAFADKFIKCFLSICIISRWLS